MHPPRRSHPVRFRHSLTTSCPRALARAKPTSGDKSLGKNRTEPSTSTALAPPGCREQGCPAALPTFTTRPDDSRMLPQPNPRPGIKIALARRRAAARIRHRRRPVDAQHKGGVRRAVDVQFHRPRTRYDRAADRLPEGEADSGTQQFTRGSDSVLRFSPSMKWERSRARNTLRLDKNGSRRRMSTLFAISGRKMASKPIRTVSARCARRFSVARSVLRSQ